MYPATIPLWRQLLGGPGTTVLHPLSTFSSPQVTTGGPFKVHNRQADQKYIFKSTTGGPATRGSAEAIVYIRKGFDK